MTPRPFVRSALVSAATLLLASCSSPAPVMPTVTTPTPATTAATDTPTPTPTPGQTVQPGELWDAIKASRQDGTLVLNTLEILTEGADRNLLMVNAAMANTEVGLPDADAIILGKDWPERMIVVKGDVFSDWGEGSYVMEKSADVDYFTPPNYFSMLLEALRDTNQVVYLGPGRFNGQDVQRYRGALGAHFLNRYYNLQGTVSPDSTAEYWLDAQGRLVQAEFDARTSRTKLWTVLTLSGFGDPITVKAPPAEEVVGR